MSLNCKHCERINEFKLPGEEHDLCFECDKEISDWLDNFPPMKPRYIEDIMENYD